MSKDLIIGGASGYTWDQIKYWINSIQSSGFRGDIVLAVTNIATSELEKVAEKGVQILAYGQKDENGNYVSNSKLPPHVDRFFHIWNFLTFTEIEYRYVITTDVRDVVFQSDPVKWIEKNIGNKELIAAGEGLKYCDEPWGNNNYLATFGQFFHNLIKEHQIFNVGVIAGRKEIVRDLMLLLLQMSINRTIPIVDQAVYNFILNLEMFKSRTLFTDNDSGWTVNLGTTLSAIQSGAGDIGLKNDVSSQILYQSKYLCEQPNVRDGIVYSGNLPCTIVHQYDRVFDLSDKIKQRYE